MRTIFCVFFFSCIATAAPLPKVVDPRFADLWAKMQDASPVKATVSAYRLSKIPGSAAFLQKHLQPITVTREDMEALLKKFNDGDEETTAAALQEMALFNPRLTHTFAEQIKIVSKDEKLLRIIGFWTSFEPEAGATIDRSSVKIANEPTREQSGSLQFTMRSATGAISSTGTSLAPTEKIYNPTVWQHRLALGVLKAAKTKDSERLLKAIAEGHERSAITVRAKQALEPEKELDGKPEKLLTELTGHEATTWLNLMFVLDNNPKRLMEVVKLLPTLNLDADKTEALMTQLDSEDEAVWKKALEQLAYHQPMIHFEIADISTKLTTGLGRGRYEIIHYGKISTEHDVSSYDKIEVREDKRIAFTNGRNRTLHYPATPETHLPMTWKPYLLLAPVLEQNAGAEAKAILKTWAGGHEKILPTKAAVECLKRLAEFK